MLHARDRCEYIVLAAKSTQGRQFERRESRWDYNIRTVLEEIIWEGLDWIHKAQDRQGTQ
jgi:hypothetical protein